MAKNFFQRFIVSLAFLGAILALSGCATCKPGKPGPIVPYTIDINLDPGLAGDSVAVDVVGVTTMSDARWENYSMTKYWQSGDEMRQGADKVTYAFGSGKATHETLSMKDPQWNAWFSRGVTRLLVIADLPGVIEDKTGSLDARRQVLSLDKCNWADGTTNLVVDIKRSGLEVPTQPRQNQ